MDDNVQDERTEEERVFDAARTVMEIVVQQLEHRGPQAWQHWNHWPPAGWFRFCRTGNGLALALHHGKPAFICTPWGGWGFAPLREPEVAEVMRHMTAAPVVDMCFRVDEDEFEIMVVAAVDGEPLPPATLPVETDFDELTQVRHRLHVARCRRNGVDPQDAPEW